MVVIVSADIADAAMAQLPAAGETVNKIGVDLALVRVMSIKQS